MKVGDSSLRGICYNCLKATKLPKEQKEKPHWKNAPKCKWTSKRCGFSFCLFIDPSFFFLPMCLVLHHVLYVFCSPSPGGFVVPSYVGFVMIFDRPFSPHVSRPRWCGPDGIFLTHSFNVVEPASSFVFSHIWWSECWLVKHVERFMQENVCYELSAMLKNLVKVYMHPIALCMFIKE